MQVNQYHWQNQSWQPELPAHSDAQLLLCFGDREAIASARATLSQVFNHAEIIGCTTSGEILGTQIFDQTLVITAIQFECTPIHVVSAAAPDYARSFDLGLALAKKLDPTDLRYVLVISDGQLVNGTELVDGLSQQLGDEVPISGGLAGDDNRFEETMVWHNELIKSGLVVAIGFYGDKIQCGHGTLGGWDAFGPERQVTKAQGNILYELDRKPALELYKKYLGEYSQELPSSALLFPLHVTMPGNDSPVVRTILHIDEASQSMTFAGDVPKGSTAQLMRANFDRLIDGAHGAAELALSSLAANGQSANLALLISCVGRRLVLGPRTEEELDAVSEVLGNVTALCGFYSYGEISPLLEQAECQLHNQTMTITTFSEKSSA